MKGAKATSTQAASNDEDEKLEVGNVSRMCTHAAFWIIR